MIIFLNLIKYRKPLEYSVFLANNKENNLQILLVIGNEIIDQFEISCDQLLKVCIFCFCPSFISYFNFIHELIYLFFQAYILNSNKFKFTIDISYIKI